jgi:hypothetical protein
MISTVLKHDESSCDMVAERRGSDSALPEAGPMPIASCWMEPISTIMPTAPREGAAGTNLGVEGIREVKIITNLSTAEYGGSSGGVISAVTRSGTNRKCRTWGRVARYDYAMNTTKYLTTSNLQAWPGGIPPGETLTNVRRANLKDGSIEEPNEESGAYAFFDWKGERYRAYFYNFEKTAKPLDRFKIKKAAS